jgi:hypothetical protein
MPRNRFRPTKTPGIMLSRLTRDSTRVYIRGAGKRLTTTIRPGLVRMK